MGGLTVNGPYSSYAYPNLRRGFDKRSREFYLLGSEASSRRQEGLGRSLKESKLDLSRTIEVLYPGYAKSRYQSSRGIRYMATGNLVTCVAIAAYNGKERIGILAHATNPATAIKAIRKAMSIKPESLFVYGGNISMATTVASIEGYIMANSLTPILAGINTNTGGKRRSVAIDTSDGSIFIPSNFTPHTPSLPFAFTNAGSIVKEIRRSIVIGFNLLPDYSHNRKLADLLRK